MDRVCDPSAATVAASTSGLSGTAYLVRNSRLPATPTIGTTYLGRPWGDGATVVYSNVWMDKHIAPAGWCPENHWRKVPCFPTNETCADTFYAEFNSSGPGANASGRVQWSHQLTAAEADDWTPEKVLRGWVPPTPASLNLTRNPATSEGEARAESTRWFRAETELTVAQSGPWPGFARLPPEALPRGHKLASKTGGVVGALRTARDLLEQAADHVPTRP